MCHRAALTLSRLYKSLCIDIRPPAGGEPTYSFASAFSLVSPWLTSSTALLKSCCTIWLAVASVYRDRSLAMGAHNQRTGAPVSSPLPAAIIQMIYDTLSMRKWERGNDNDRWFLWRSSESGKRKQKYKSRSANGVGGRGAELKGSSVGKRGRPTKKKKKKKSLKAILTKRRSLKSTVCHQ